MNQIQLAKNLGYTHQHLNAVVKGREDAGKKLAEGLSGIVGGTLDIWMLSKHRGARKQMVDNYIGAFKKGKLPGVK